MKNNKDLISEVYIMKIYWHDDSRMMKNRAQDTKTRIFRGGNKIGEK